MASLTQIFTIRLKYRAHLYPLTFPSLYFLLYFPPWMPLLLPCGFLCDFGAAPTLFYLRTFGFFMPLLWIFNFMAAIAIHHAALILWKSSRTRCTKFYWLGHSVNQQQAMFPASTLAQTFINRQTQYRNHQNAVSQEFIEPDDIFLAFMPGIIQTKTLFLAKVRRAQPNWYCQYRGKWLGFGTSFSWFGIGP